MRKSDLVVEKYWVTQSGYFRLATTLELFLEVANGIILLCHGILYGSEDKKISTREYNDKTVY